jgi:hypothetical protein
VFQPYTSRAIDASYCWRSITDGQIWAPLLDVSIIYRGYESGGLKGVVDSGATVTVIEASIGERLGIPVRSGPTDRLAGFMQNDDATIYFHHIQLRVAGASVRTRAGFCYGLPVQALLGRHGFFDHFKITFDPLRRGMQIDRIAECYDSI